MARTSGRTPRAAAPSCGVVRELPDGTFTSPDQVGTFYETLSEQHVEVAPVWFDGAGYLRIAAAPYNTPDDYDRLADVVWRLLHGR
jgi:isopenicillin-N epimerase